MYPIGPNHASTWSMKVTTRAPRPQLRTKVAVKNRHTERLVSSPCRAEGQAPDWMPTA